MNAPRFSFNAINLLNIVGAIVIIYLMVVLGSTIKHNYDLSRQVDTLRAQIALLKDQNDSLAYSIQYYQTDSFKEREARAKLGLQQPGENVVILPRPTTTASVTAPDPTTKSAKKKSNFQQWLDFFSGNS